MNYQVNLPQNLKTILKIIEKNAMGIVFVVDKDKKLLGSLTDGDIRRAILSGIKIKQQVDLKFKFLNKKPFWLPIGASIQKILSHIDGDGPKNYKCIPLLNKDKQLIDIATYARVKSFPVASPLIGDEELINVISAFKSGYISSVGKFVGEFEKSFEK